MTTLPVWDNKLISIIFYSFIIIRLKVTKKVTKVTAK